MSIFKRMAQTAGIAAVALTGVLALANTASADTVTFSTQGAFNGGAFSVSPTLSTPSGNLTFTGAPSDSYDPPTAPDDVFFGTFSYAGNSQSLVGNTFTLGIFQTAPGAGSDQLVGTFSGTVRQVGSGAQLFFSDNTAQINAGGFVTTYTILTPNNVPGAIIGGIQQIPGAAVPSPTAAAGGLVLLTGALLRRRSARTDG